MTFRSQRLFTTYLQAGSQVPKKSEVAAEDEILFSMWFAQR